MSSAKLTREHPLWEELLNRRSQGHTYRSLAAYYVEQTGEQISERAVRQSLQRSGDIRVLPIEMRGYLASRLQLVEDDVDYKRLLDAVLEDVGVQYFELRDKGDEELTEEEIKQKGQLGKQVFNYAFELYSLSQKLGYQPGPTVNINMQQINVEVSQQLTVLRDQMLIDFEEVVKRHVAEERGIVRLLRQKEVIDGTRNVSAPDSIH